MVGKKKANVLGRSLIKNRFSNTTKRKVEENMLHVADLKDGYDWARLNLQSVTEEDSFTAFLKTAELAGTEFVAEKLNIQFVNPKSTVGLLTESERRDMENKISENKDLLKIPRRPKWNKDTTPEELHTRENQAFLEWRRDLALLQEKEGLLMTPYERNIEFWRQLWRVIEKSDVVVQIVDARNPLLFRSEDLEMYVKEVDENKQNLLLLNKADFLTEQQRINWAEYFDERNIRVAFFSAVEAAAEDEKEESSEEENDEEFEDSSEDDDEDEKEMSLKEIKEKVQEISGELEEVEKVLDKIAGVGDLKAAENLKNIEGSVTSGDTKNDGEATKTINNPAKSTDASCEATKTSSEASKVPQATESSSNSSEPIDKPSEPTNESGPSTTSPFPAKNDPKILTRLELIEFFKAIRRSHPSASGKDSVIIGLMGYPNVGKSSTINALLQEKKVSVSATPGKTKHFQTLYLEKDLILCDCCGLVLPSFCVTKADMILNGILPIDQMRDYVPPVNTLCTMIPRHVLEENYGILIAKPLEGEDSSRPPHAEELLLAYGYNRGFMTANGQPDQSRAARKILKDFVNGKLLFCCAPPTVKQNEFHAFPERRHEEISLATLPPRQQRSMKIATGKTSSEIDAVFFNTGASTAHVQGRNLGNYKQGAVMVGATKNPEKPWKGQKREKREKLRRKYVHLDQH